MPLKVQRSFSPKSTRRLPNIDYGGTNITWSENVKYLGLTLDHRLNWSEHINRRVQSTRKIILQLLPLIGRNSVLSLKNKLRIHKSVIVPHLYYGCQIWGYTNNTNINKIQAVQSRNLRTITRSPWFLRNQHIFSELKIPLARDYIKNLSEIFYSKAENHQCVSLKELLNSYDEDTPLKYKRPRSVLWS